MMMFLKLSVALCSLSSWVAYVHAIAIVSRDTVSPPIILPNFNTIWTAGQEATVTWDLTQLPPATDITNVTAKLMLGNLTASSENLDFDHPLASGFLILTGNVTFQVPADTPTGDTYIVCLLGSTSDISQPFRINGVSGAGSTSSTSSSASTSSTSGSSSTAGSSGSNSETQSPTSSTTPTSSATSPASAPSNTAPPSQTQTPPPTSLSQSSSTSASATGNPNGGSSNGAFSWRSSAFVKSVAAGIGIVIGYALL